MQCVQDFWVFEELIENLDKILIYIIKYNLIFKYLILRMEMGEKGRLIVFEGTDCSGKSTQINLFIKNLEAEGKRVCVLDFPNYSTPTGKIVRKYLDNSFGPANEVDAKIASIFFAEDRFASKPIIEKALEENDVVILDRYVESNMGHQGGKMNLAERKNFWEWLVELEYGIFGLPKPDMVIFLHMPYLVSMELMKNRERKSEFHPAEQGGGDGHESNSEHMRNAEEAYVQLAELYNWIKIECVDNDLRKPEDIADEIWKKFQNYYSEKDRTVLNYFFTNLDSEIFAVRNFHPEVWALMQARYSRSSEGLRESFLQLLKEEPDNFEMLYQEIKNSNSGAATKHATDKAIKFMEKWVLGYGHSSIAEGAVVGLGLEGVSILATKVIEDNRLSSFCEKSTRYVSFDKNSFYIDEDLKNSEFYLEIKELIDLLFNTYMELYEPVLNYIRGVCPIGGAIESAWERSCAARRFDAIRYLLPTCTKTSLGWTVNARELAYGISKFLSHPLKEINKIGEMIKTEASKILPSLLKYAERNNYFIKTDREMGELVRGAGAGFQNLNESVRLVKGNVDADDIVVSAVLYKYMNKPFSEIANQVKNMSLEEKEQVVDSYLGSMGKFDYPMRELEHVDFTFDIVIDYGAFRDLQRHRICTQTNQMLNTDLGYDVPQDIVNAGCGEKYNRAMDKAKEVYERVAKKFPLQAQYILPLGFKKRYLLTMNLREIYHLVKLRTSPLGHESYRKIATRIYELMKENYPLLSKYLVCQKGEELGRLKAEEKTEMKRKELR